jgi:hypothetical protein
MLTPSPNHLRIISNNSFFFWPKPRGAVKAQFASTVTRRKRTQNALIYAASSILLGICFARFIGLPNSPSEVNPQTAVGVLVVWILSAGVLHPILKLFRAKGVLQDTVVVFLLVISTLHLLFIPILAVASRMLTDTKVTLSYDYVIYFGPPRGVRGESAKALTENWRKRLIGEHTESFIKEKESGRDKTILPPAQDLSSYDNAAAVPLSPESRTRVSPSTLNLQLPTRSEVPVLRDGIERFLLCFWSFTTSRTRLT